MCLVEPGVILGQSAQDPVQLHLAVAREHGGESDRRRRAGSPGVPGVESASASEAVALDGMFEQAVVPDPDVGPRPGVQDQPDIGDLLLLELPGEELARMAGSQAPVEPAQRIAGVILAHPPKVGAAAAQARRDRARASAGCSRAAGGRGGNV